MIPNLTWGSDFAGLTDYLVQHRDHAVMSLRGVSSIYRAPDEMQAVAAMSERVRKPAMHVSFSAAVEDGTLTDATWLELVKETEEEFDLADHQRVVVRHRDKGYDHIHVFWCTVIEEAGRTPPKQWFRTDGAARPELDQRALNSDIRSSFAQGEIVKGAFNRFALSRLMNISRDFEAAHGLRQLRNRKAMALAREAGEARPPRPAEQHREERTGRPPLSSFADTIRAALDAPNYALARSALNLAGFDLEPIVRNRKDGAQDFRGLVIFDAADPGNRATASSFDLPDRRYGMRQIEKRHEAGAPTIEQWWPVRGEATATLSQPALSDRQERAAYERLRENHRLAEAAKTEQRRRLAERHTRERQRLRIRLMRLRRLRAARLASTERRAFHSQFALTTRTKIWAAMERRQAKERLPLRRTPLPKWKADSKQSANIASPQGTWAASSVTSVPKTTNTYLRDYAVQENVAPAVVHDAQAEHDLLDPVRAKFEKRGR